MVLGRLKSLLSEKRHLSAVEIRKEILADLKAYQQGELPHDDIALVVIKFQ